MKRINWEHSKSQVTLRRPLPLPKSLYGRRTFVRWRHNQIFSAWWVTNFPYQWCFAGALRALNLHYNETNSIEQSWRSGENTRLSPILRGPGSTLPSTPRSLLFSGGYPQGTPVFPSHQKPKFEFDLIWFDLICCDSVWFVVFSIRKATCLAQSTET